MYQMCVPLVEWRGLTKFARRNKACVFSQVELGYFVLEFSFLQNILLAVDIQLYIREKAGAILKEHVFSGENLFSRLLAVDIQPAKCERELVPS